MSLVGGYFPMTLYRFGYALVRAHSAHPTDCLPPMGATVVWPLCQLFNFLAGMAARQCDGSGCQWCACFLWYILFVYLFV